MKTKDYGLAAEFWSISALAKFVSEHALCAGFARLAHAGKSTVWRILDDNGMNPYKIRYYLEKRNLNFDCKMEQVLRAYWHVSINVRALFTAPSPIQLHTPPASMRSRCPGHLPDITVVKQGRVSWPLLSKSFCADPLEESAMEQMAR